MAIDPLIKRIIVDPPAPGVPSKGLRLFCGVSFAVYLGAVLYAKHVSPRDIHERIRKDMFTAPPSSGH